MHTKFIIPAVLVVITAILLASSGNDLLSVNEGVKLNNASVLGWSLKSDTSGMSIADYQKEIDRLKEEIKELKKNKFRFHFDSDKFKKHMKALSIELDSLNCTDFHFNFDFNSEEFKEQMKELRENFKHDKHVWKNFHFDVDEFNEEMKDLQEELKDMHFNFHFDSESFAEEMDELSENLEDLEIDMGDLEIDMDNLNVELKKLEAFVEEMKSEMVKDGMISDVEEDCNIILSKDEMKVNGETVQEELHQKYLDIYEKHFGHMPSHSFKLHTH